MPHFSLRTGFAVFAITFAASTLNGCAPMMGQNGWSVPSSTPAYQPSSSATPQDRHLPGLIVSDEPAPDVIYRKGSRDTILAPSDANASMNIPSFSTKNVETLVTQKAKELRHDLDQLQDGTESSDKQLQQLQAKNDAGAAEYYAIVASINTELQSGTTPGNPVMVDRWNVAQDKLNALADQAGLLNAVATDLSNQASHASFLQEAVQDAFALSGAVKEDHEKLRAIEDGINRNIIAINRLLLKVNDEIGRRTTYLRAERANLQTLSLGISNGELYGQSLTNSLFRKATGDGKGLFKAAPPAPASRRPLVVIRFDRPDVNYDQALYTAISQAMEKYPSARFDLVAVSNMEGNAAQMALSTAEARKNGEAVLRSLTQMGLPLERIRLSAASSKDVVNSEVHIYLQ